jgi:hypothetical protein
MKTDSTLFESHSIRRIYDEELGILRLSVVGVVQVLPQVKSVTRNRKIGKDNNKI